MFYVQLKCWILLCKVPVWASQWSPAYNLALLSHARIEHAFHFSCFDTNFFFLLSLNSKSWYYSHLIDKGDLESRPLAFQFPELTIQDRFLFLLETSLFYLRLMIFFVFKIHFPWESFTAACNLCVRYFIHSLGHLYWRRSTIYAMGCYSENPIISEKSQIIYNWAPKH